VLLRAGFCLPPVLPRARCALTAPFHHCRPRPLRASARQALRPAVGCVFSVPLILQVTLTGRYPAHCPAEFGLSSSAFAPLSAPADAIVWPAAAALLSVGLLCD